MATSGSTDFSMNGGEIVTDSLRLINVVSDEETATGAQITTGLRFLNRMVKAWQTKVGYFQWSKTEGSLSFVTGQASYDMGSGGDFAARPLKIIHARRKDAGGREIPMLRLAREDYFALPLKTTQGTPTQYYYDPQLGTGKLYVWPAPDASAGTFEFTYIRTIEDFDETSHDPDYPVEWLDALTYNLALRLAPIYGVEQPDPHVVGIAQESLSDVMDWDDELGELVFVSE